MKTTHLTAVASAGDLDSYFLPRQEIQVAVTYSLLSCGETLERVQQAPGGELKDVWKASESGLLIRKTATITVANEADPNARFAIDPKALQAKTKTTESSESFSCAFDAVARTSGAYS